MYLLPATLTERQLHFAAPPAFLDIYNNRNRWDKEEALYHSLEKMSPHLAFSRIGKRKKEKTFSLASSLQRPSTKHKGLSERRCGVFLSLLRVC